MKSRTKWPVLIATSFLTACATGPGVDLTCARMLIVPWDDGFVHLETDTLRTIEANNRTLERVCP